VKKPVTTNRYRSLLLWAAGLIILLLGLYEIVAWTWLADLPGDFWAVVNNVLVILVAALAFLLVERSLSWREERQDTEDKIDRIEAQAARNSERQAALMAFSVNYAESGDEDQVIDQVLRLSLELVGAKAASYVPLDDRFHPLPPVMRGDMPSGVSGDWLEYLASPSVRERCAPCDRKESLVYECPLLIGPPITGSKPGDLGIFCAPFIRGEHEYGVLNLYIPGSRELDNETRLTLRKIIDEATLAFEGIRLRKRELMAFRELQLVRAQTDLDGLLSNLLEGLKDTLEADFARLVVSKTGEIASSVSIGELPASAHPMIDGILKTVMTSGESVVLGDSSRDASGDMRANTGMRAFIGIPLIFQEEKISGGLVLASRRVKAFKPREVSLVHTITNQIGLVVQYADLMAEMRYKTVIEERGRLAREIHDGLAQILGFLKLKAAQLKGFSQQGDIHREQETVQVIYEALSEAYLEVRQAIDGLRLSAKGAGLNAWLHQAVNEFLDNSELTVNICEPLDDPDLTPEVNAELIRIIQEALNNARKHSRGTQVWISCQLSGEDIILEIRDDGRGFDVDDVPGYSQHGLQGMRERADLIGADFQVISRPREGTTVRVRLPLTVVGDRV
jgi:two-component system nitrate/nitrite sensor histidine kinase NarX